MDNQAIEKISNELIRAGKDVEREAILSELEQCRITPDKDIPPMQFLFRMFCKPCFPRGELVAIAGKAKSGKTFVSSILMTLCFRKEVLTVERIEEGDLRVLWFDTEQSEESTQDILNHRVLPMIEETESEKSIQRGIRVKKNIQNREESSSSAKRSYSSLEASEEEKEGRRDVRDMLDSSSAKRSYSSLEAIKDEEHEEREFSSLEVSSLWSKLRESFHIFNVRAKFWQERAPLLEAAVSEYKPDLVILDGIRDLVNDINDGVMAQDTIERLMHLAAENRCCIVCILHQNKSLEDKNLRGWIGTELKNKAFEVYECSKDADRIFTWTQTDTRKYDILDKLKYIVGDEGIPQLCTIEKLLESQRNAAFVPTNSSRPPFVEDYVLERNGKNITIDVKKLFTDAIPEGAEMDSTLLQELVMKISNITSSNFYNKQKNRALSEGIICERKTPHGCIMYSRKTEVKKEPPAQGNLFESPGEAPF